MWLSKQVEEKATRLLMGKQVGESAGRQDAARAMLVSQADVQGRSRSASVTHSASVYGSSKRLSQSQQSVSM